jgi:hypothetical protein
VRDQRDVGQVDALAGVQRRARARSRRAARRPARGDAGAAVAAFAADAEAHAFVARERLARAVRELVGCSSRAGGG